MRQGWEALLSEPTLRAFAATAFTANFLYRVIMSVYVLYLTRDLGLSAATVGVIFGFGGGLGVLIGSMLSAPVARMFGVGRSMIAAHVLFGILGIPLALSAFVPRYATALVFASEFLQLAVNAVYMVNRTSDEQALSPPELRGRIQTSRNVFHAVAGILGLTFGSFLGTTLTPAAAIVVGVIGGLTSFICLLFSPLYKARRTAGLSFVSTFSRSAPERGSSRPRERRCSLATARPGFRRSREQVCQTRQNGLVRAMADQVLLGQSVPPTLTRAARSITDDYIRTISERLLLSTHS